MWFFPTWTGAFGPTITPQTGAIISALFVVGGFIVTAIEQKKKQT